VSLLPSSALADLLRWSAGAASTTSGALPVDAVILGVWGAIGAVIAARTFRWR